MQPNHIAASLRIVLLGDKSSGKSTFASAFAPPCQSDASVSVHARDLIYDGTLVTLNLIDLAESESADATSLRQLARRLCADQFVLCFPLADEPAWTRASEQWLRQLQQCGVPFMVVGTHADRLSRADRGDALEFHARFWTSPVIGAQCFRPLSLGNQAQLDAAADAALRSAMYRRELDASPTKQWCALN
jgi:GTPase SAR1 family protein